MLVETFISSGYCSAVLRFMAMASTFLPVGLLHPVLITCTLIYIKRVTVRLRSRLSATGLSLAFLLPVMALSATVVEDVGFFVAGVCKIR